MIIALIGMMGSGKSSAGRLLAARLSLPFADTDALAEEAAGMSIAELIRARGEDEFRRRESAALRQALSERNQVLATGGGIVLDEDNRALLRDSAQVVHLDAAAETLAARVSANRDARPLLADAEDLAERLAELLQARRTLYEAARHYHIMQEANDTAQAVADKILALPGIAP